AAGGRPGLRSLGSRGAVGARGRVRALLRPPGPSVEPRAGYGKRVLAVGYLDPGHWAAIGLSTGPGPPPGRVLSRSSVGRAAASGGDLTRVDHIQSTVMAMSRPAAGTTVVADARDPVVALTTEVAPLVAAPPPGLKVEVTEPVHAATVGNRSGAVVVLKLTRGDAVTYLRRALVYAPRPGVAAIFQVAAL